MAAIREQGTYLGSTLAGFTAFTAGLVLGKAVGIVVAIAGAALLIFAAVGFYKIKNLESTE